MARSLKQWRLDDERWRNPTFERIKKNRRELAQAVPKDCEARIPDPLKATLNFPWIYRS